MKSRENPLDETTRLPGETRDACLDRIDEERRT